MIRKRTNLPVAFILLSICLPAPAEVYRWVDENGQVHFDDRPAGEQSTQIKMKSAPGKQVDHEQRMDKTRRLLNAYQSERQRDREQRAEQQRAAEEKKRNCNKARDDLRSAREAGAIYKLDNNGERVYYSDRQREQTIEKYQQAVRDWCG